MRIPAGVACACLLPGCLYSTQHFNTGRLLEPGQSSLTLGAGSMRSFEYDCGKDWNVYPFTDSTGTHCVTNTMSIDSLGNAVYAGDTLERAQTWSTAPKASLGYRVGVSGKWGLFTGTEIGLHLEAPTNPVSGEFDLKLGLPVPAGRPYHHSLSAGWGIGIWADNSWFVEYALSRSWGGNDLFAGYRGTYLATQFPDLDDAESDRRFGSKRRFIHQANIGFKWMLPDIPVVPDFLVPVAVLSYPLAPFHADDVPDPLLDDALWDLSLGMGWDFQ
jgi:hypothetical protein